MTATQSNPSLRNGLALAAHMNVSTLSTVVATEILTSPQLPSLLALNSSRLAQAYTRITAFLKRLAIPYFPCNAGPFILARVAPNASSWEHEAAVVLNLQLAGVLVGAGRSYHVHSPGWARICFAVEEMVLEEAMRRMETVLTVS